MKSAPLLSWMMLALALAAWAAVIYAHIWLNAEARERGSQAKSIEQRSEEMAHLSRLRSLAGETVAEREQLAQLSRADIVSIASEIENAGTAVGVVAKVSAAIPVGSPVELPGGEPLHTIAFIVQAEGRFASIVQFARALESFPAFSSIEQLEFEKIQLSERPADSWRSSIRLHIQAISDI